MQIIINLIHDTITYDETSMKGTLKSGLFGAEDFSIHKSEETTTIWFDVDQEYPFSVWSFPCEVTDHNKRLVVTVE